DRLSGERRLPGETLSKWQPDRGRGPRRHAGPELVLLPVYNVDGASLGVDRLRAEVHETAEVRLAILLDGEMPELDQDDRDLVVEHGLVIPRDDHSANGKIRCERGLRGHELAKAIDLPARHELEASLHQHGAEVDCVDVVAELAECLARDDNLVTSRDVGRGKTRRDV